MQRIPRAVPDVEGAEYARGYERGCHETRGRVIEQLYQYNRQFPFALIPEISALGSSLYPLPREPVEIGGPSSADAGSAPGSSTVVHTSGGSVPQDEDVGHAADADGMPIFGVSAGPDVGATAEDRA